MEIIVEAKNETYLLSSDSKDYTLSRKVESKNEETGEVKMSWAAFNWFSTLEGALAKLMELKVRSSQAATLAELRDDVIEAKKEIAGVWKLA